jgi:hypothetical protein
MRRKQFLVGWQIHDITHDKTRMTKDMRISLSLSVGYAIAYSGLALSLLLAKAKS